MDLLNPIDQKQLVGNILSCTPPVVERVLSHLPMKDLHCSAQVCRLWCDVAQLIKKKRTQPVWMFWVTSKVSKTNKSKRKISEEDDARNHINSVISTASSEPRLALLFASRHFFEDDAFSVAEYLASTLPPECVLLGTGTDGIVGTKVDGSSAMEEEKLMGFSCLVLPHIPGVETYHFVIRDAEQIGHSSRNKILHDEEFASLTGIPMNKHIKCLLLFCNTPEEGRIGAKVVLNTVLEKQNGKVAIGGGYVENIVAPENMMSSDITFPHTMGIAICGDNVEAASIILKHKVKSKNDVEKAIRELKLCGFSEKRSFAFMFACVARGRHHYKEENVEPSVFHKEFPNTPLFGLFGNGEIGTSYLPLPDEDRQKKKI